MKKAFPILFSIVLVSLINVGLTQNNLDEGYKMKEIYSAETFIENKVNRHCKCVGELVLLHNDLKSVQTKFDNKLSQQIKSQMFQLTQNMENCRRGAKQEIKAYRQFINRLSVEEYARFETKYSEELTKNCPTVALAMGYKL